MKPFLAFLIAVAAGLLLGKLGTQTTVRAQEGCTNATLKGAYSYALSGFFFSPDFGIFACTGRIVADGNGSLSGFDTVSENGLVRRNRRFTGSYTVQPQCAGTATFTGEDGVVLGNLDLVITNNGRDIQIIQTDRGTTISGSAKQQFPQ